MRGDDRCKRCKQRYGSQKRGDVFDTNRDMFDTLNTKRVWCVVSEQRSPQAPAVVDAQHHRQVVQGYWLFEQYKLPGVRSSDDPANINDIKYGTDQTNRAHFCAAPYPLNSITTLHCNPICNMQTQYASYCGYAMQCRMQCSMQCGMQCSLDIRSANTLCFITHPPASNIIIVSCVL